MFFLGYLAGVLTLGLLLHFGHRNPKHSASAIIFNAPKKPVEIIEASTEENNPLIIDEISDI